MMTSKRTVNLPELPRAVDISSNIKRGEDGFYLLAAVAMTLHVGGRLKSLTLGVEDTLLKDMHPHVAPSGANFLVLSDLSIESYSDELLYPLYCLVMGGKVHHPEVLNLWIRAWSRGANTYMNVHSRCLSSEVLVSLVERGGDILMALRL